MSVKQKVGEIFASCNRQGIVVHFTHRNRISEINKCTFVAFDGRNVTVHNLDRNRDLVRVAKTFPKAAMNACGYTLCEATFPDGTTHRGIAICSSKDKYNGDLGVIKSFYDMHRRRAM